MSAPLPPSESVEDALLALLEWYEAMGVDGVLAEAPIDRFAESAAEKARRTAAAKPVPAGERPDPRRVPAEPRREVSAAAAIPAVSPPPAETVHAARAAATSAATLEELEALVRGFDGCSLKLTAKTTVFADGNPAARLMFVGEAPGREEDEQGKPFVGRSGQLLDRMLAAIGMTRAEHAYIANAVYWRPPGNRDPSDQEVAVCRPFILRQIELVDPDVLVFLGAQPVKALLGGELAKPGIRRLRGRWLDFDTGRRRIRALPTFHPAYLLRNPIEKRMAWRDMLAVRAALKGD